MAASPYKVLIVDDSAFIRTLLSDYLKGDKRFELVGAARNGAVALDLILTRQPDIVILDLIMPDMDGIGLLQELKVRGLKIPVIVFSSQAKEDADVTAQAFALGALDIVLKPDSPASVRVLKDEFVSRMLAILRRTDRELQSPAPVRARPRVAPRFAIRQPVQNRQIVAIGISTGGPNTLSSMLPLFPAGFGAPILIVQHMPEGFTAAFARRLDEACALRVHEACDGEPLEPGHVYVAPGGRHLVVKKNRRDEIFAALSDEAPVTGFRPSATVLFRSVAEIFGRNALGVIMTGMGSDGCEGLESLKEAGGTIVAQDEESCVVYGMPRVAVERDLADRVLPFPKIPEYVQTWLVKRRAGGE